MKTVLISLFIFFCILPFHAQESMISKNIQDSIFKQLQLYPQEKIHLHIDRDIYVPGERIWFKAYVADALTHLSPTYSRFVYVELISPSDSLVQRVMISMENGMFHGHLFLADKLPIGEYTIRAYTRYMQQMGDDYFFKKNIEIASIIKKDEVVKKSRRQREITYDYDVSFFPEGGHIIEDAFCRIAFKALNEKGFSENISGEIIDENGVVVVSNVNTLYAGMGSFFITAEKGKKYYLESRNNKGTKKRFLLPAAYDNTLSISTNWNNSRGRFYFSIKSAANNLDIPHYILILSKGVVYYFFELEKDNDYFFDEKHLPSGVVQLLLLDKDLNPVSERLIFNKTEDQIKTVFTTDKNVYEKRDLVSSKIKLSDLEGNTLSGNLSVAITDDADIAIDSLTTITSSLLLSSELKGYIETPAYYLQDNRDAKYALDLLMMTHGWRRYNIPEVIKGNMEVPNPPMEASKEVSGAVKSLFLEKPIEKAEVTLISTSGSLKLTETNEKGEFLFDDIFMPDSVRIFIQSMNKKGRPNAILEVNEVKFPELKHIPYTDIVNYKVNYRVNDSSAELKKEEDVFLKKAEQRSMYDEDMRHIQLDEVVVTAKAKVKKDEVRLKYWANLGSDVTIYRENFDKFASFMLLSDYLRTVGSLFVTNNVGDNVAYFLRNMSIGVNGAVPALMIVDGFIDDYTCLNLPLSEIESIDLFKDGQLFGSQGMGGVISITTRRGEPGVISPKLNVKTLAPLGFQTPLEFYSPKYDTPAAKALNNPDFRTTIFWKPDVVVDENGEAHFDFYTSDFASTYSVVIEGLSDDGQIIRQVEKIEVK